MANKTLDELETDYNALGAQMQELDAQRLEIGIEIDRQRTEAQAAAVLESLSEGQRAAIAHLTTIQMGIQANGAEVQANG